jgi:hypothetical protein
MFRKNNFSILWPKIGPQGQPGIQGPSGEKGESVRISMAK